MIKTLISLIAVIAFLTSSVNAEMYQCDSDGEICDTEDTYEPNTYTDVMVSFYNSTCIETANWQYVIVNYSDEEMRPCIGAEFIIEELEQIGPKTVIANVYFP